MAVMRLAPVSRAEKVTDWKVNAEDKLYAPPSSSPVVKILIGVPAFNEEVAIGSIVLRSLRQCDGVVVVDDCCTDRTTEIARLAGADIIVHAVNQGKGAAVRDIFAYAGRENADILVLIDGDGQHDPGEIGTLLAPLLDDSADMVIGSRFLARTSGHIPAYRRLGQATLTMATNLIIDTPVTDSQSGFRAFSRRSFDCFSFKCDGMEIESEMLVEAASAGLRITEVPVRVRYDVDGSTYHPLPHGLRVLKYTLKRVIAIRPMMLLGFVGPPLLLTGLAFLYMAMATYSATGDAAQGYLLLFALAVALGTIALLTTLWRRGREPGNDTSILAKTDDAYR
jgi:glycosyltransferase involved in cell wall biosynthesis